MPIKLTVCPDKITPVKFNILHIPQLIYQDLQEYIIFIHYNVVGQDSSVSMATRYRLGPWIETRWGGEIFCNCPNRSWIPPSLLQNGYPGVKRPGRGVDHPPPSSAKVKERVELHRYSTSRPSWPVQG